MTVMRKTLPVNAVQIATRINWEKGEGNMNKTITAVLIGAGGRGMGYTNIMEKLGVGST